jgi:hypothetical protein
MADENLNITPESQPVTQARLQAEQLSSMSSEDLIKRKQIEDLVKRISENQSEEKRQQKELIEKQISLEKYREGAEVRAKEKEALLQELQNRLQVAQGQPELIKRQQDLNALRLKQQAELTPKETELRKQEISNAINQNQTQKLNRAISTVGRLGQNVGSVVGGTGQEPYKGFEVLQTQPQTAPVTQQAQPALEQIGGQKPAANRVVEEVGGVMPEYKEGIYGEIGGEIKGSPTYDVWKDIGGIPTKPAIQRSIPVPQNQPVQQAPQPQRRPLVLPKVESKPVTSARVSHAPVIHAYKPSAKASVNTLIKEKPKHKHSHPGRPRKKGRPSAEALRSRQRRERG